MHLYAHDTGGSLRYASCARIGAIHSVVFGGFSPQALEDRILDADCNFVITANEGLRGGKTIPLKQNDKALENCPNVNCYCRKRTENDVNWVDGLRFLVPRGYGGSIAIFVLPKLWIRKTPFILYTSGSTGKPKGVQHSTAGYLLHAAITHKYVFDYHDGDIYWCTADVGWITGHSYIVYVAPANGATTLMFEGVPNYPSPSRCWQVIDKHRVNIFYTAPTAIRQLMSEGDTYVNDTDRSSLITLGTVGEPINQAWDWYYRVVGSGRCPIVDTYWQTETGGIMISPLPGAIDLKPGSATKPFFGILPGLVDNEGALITEQEASGNLVINCPWPGQIRTVYGDHQRVIDTYYSAYKGFYFTGDGAGETKMDTIG